MAKGGSTVPAIRWNSSIPVGSCSRISTCIGLSSGCAALAPTLGFAGSTSGVASSFCNSERASPALSMVGERGMLSRKLLIFSERVYW